MILEITKTRNFRIMVTERTARKDSGYCMKGRGTLHYWSYDKVWDIHTQIPAGSMVYLMMKVVDQKVYVLEVNETYVQKVGDQRAWDVMQVLDAHDGIVRAGGSPFSPAAVEPEAPVQPGLGATGVEGEAAAGADVAVRKKVWVFIRGQKCTPHIRMDETALQQVKDFVWQTFQVNFYDLQFYDEGKWWEIYGGPRDEELQHLLQHRRRMAFADEPTEDMDQQVSDQSDEEVCDNPPAEDEHMEVAHTHTPALRAAALG